MCVIALSLRNGRYAGNFAPRPIVTRVTLENKSMCFRYISWNYVCFYSNIFGHKTQVRPFSCMWPKSSDRPIRG